MFHKKTNNNLIKFVKEEFLFKDDRGSLMQIVSSGWNQVNYIESNANSFRGNHFHEINRELFYVIDGRFTLTLELNNEKLKYDMQKNDLFIIEPFVKHSFEFLEKTSLITMYDIGVELKNGKKDILI